MSGNQYDAYDATPVSVPDLPAEVDQDLSSEQVAYYRQVLAVHSTKPDTNACAVCGVARCPDWLYAFDVLAVAHQVMTAEPQPWGRFQPRVRPRPSK